MHGRLQEVDLGDEVRARNAAMTEQARRRLAGETIEDESDGSRGRPRVGKDGKPWRGRKRRASDDIKRDQMVEALMRENRRKFFDERSWGLEIANLFLQSISMIRRPKLKQRQSLVPMRLQTRGSQRSFVANLWMRWRRGETNAGGLQLLRLEVEPSRRRYSRARSWVAVATQELQCEICYCLSRRRTKRGDNGTRCACSNLTCRTSAPKAAAVI